MLPEMAAMMCLSLCGLVTILLVYPSPLEEKNADRESEECPGNMSAERRGAGEGGSPDGVLSSTPLGKT